VALPFYLWLESLWRKGINIFCISFLFINVINLSSINEKGVDLSSYAKSVSVNMIQVNDLKGSTPSNVTREPMFIRW
jgi:hypothetical protein